MYLRIFTTTWVSNYLALIKKTMKLAIIKHFDTKILELPK